MVSKRKTISLEDSALARPSLSEREGLEVLSGRSIDEPDPVPLNKITSPEPVEDLIIEEITIDGICGVY